MGKTIAQLEAEVRALYPGFQYAEALGLVYIKRWDGISMITSANTLATGGTKKDALISAASAVKNEIEHRKRVRLEKVRGLFGLAGVVAERSDGKVGIGTHINGHYNEVAVGETFEAAVEAAERAVTAPKKRT